MSRDQKPGRSKIVVNTERRRVPEASAAVEPPPAGAAPPGAATRARSPVLGLALLFVAACTAGGVGTALLPWVMR